MKTGKLIRQLRSKASLTQTQLAKKLGHKSGQFISNVERGVSNVPIQSFTSLSKCLKLNASGQKKLLCALVDDYRIKIQSHI